jgi:hypothetical protein
VTCGGDGSGGAPGTGGEANSGGTGGGPVVAEPASCLAALLDDPAAESGTYSIAPEGIETPFDVYCDMTTDGGGWTLVFNDDDSFDQSQLGGTGSTCFAENCANRAYSVVDIGEDIMFQTADVDMSTTNDWAAQVIIDGVHAASRDRTLHELMNVASTSAKYFGEAENNSNLIVSFNSAASCPIAGDFGQIICGNNVFAFSDYNDNTACIDDRAVGETFAIGGEVSYTDHWYNCAGWPQQTVNQMVRVFPRNFRAYVR